MRLTRSVPALLAGTVLLAGCATGYKLDNTVQSFSGLPSLPANPSYRFERLPSQLASPDQTQLEGLADPALFRAGLRRDDASPRYSVLLTARVQRVYSPWADPWAGGWGWGGFGPRWGMGFGGPFPRMEQPWFQREVGVIVRELAGNKVVFESHASNDGPYVDNAVVLSAMFDAAMQGFPNPPDGVRRVNIQIGGTQAAAAPTVAPTAPVAPAAPAAPGPRPAASAAR
ncbi:MAG TPA: hypothetical protein VFE82_10235 [Ramlibacter sp.]|jgi:hypothetical protein|uniref:DUF4136 domain-containing protein n=1 Tax=Ramlibacter sp. TaxID=1917967 RepID=UPI002D750774|nr:hypothetical protein [Ramlibacter sp.]HZY18850.1 hypothetical protein [Ramlibacter sp.]